MKKLTMMLAVLLAGSACCAAAGDAAARLKANKALITLADARSRIDKSIANPKVMKAIMQHLSAEDQKTYLADVNAAIATMPASEADRVTTYVQVNRAALEGAQRGNVSALVAESYATVQPAALPALSESLSSDLMNRATDKNRTYTDDEYLRVCSNIMVRVNERAAESKHADVRCGFAALMLVRGSNSTKPEIVDAVTAMLPASAQGPAKSEWFPAALAEGSAKNYDAMLAAADVDAPIDQSASSSDVAKGENGEKEHDTNEDYWRANGGTPVTLRVPGPVLATSLIHDIVGADDDVSRKVSQAMPVRDALISIDNIPMLGTFGSTATAIEEARRRDALYNAGKSDSDNPEPGPYQWQSTHN